MSDLIQQLKKLKDQALEELKSVTDSETYERLYTKYLGRRGELAQLAKYIKEVADKERPVIGGVLNEVKRAVEQGLEEVKQTMVNALPSSSSAPKMFDPTIPGAQQDVGSLHPITQATYELNDAFHSLGFEVYEGPEISSEAFVFDAMNFPANHPARESMDTYWLEGSQSESGYEKFCLRPHLTGASVRYMKTHEPPFCVVYPGRVFRSEALDARHERTFYQYEALMVDRTISFASGKLLINTILERYFGKEMKTRFRAGFFPFVEPGFEIDMECVVCKQQGCSVCNKTGWLEMMPGGMTHPNVFRAGGIDPNKWSGFYINIGLNRLVMMKYGIDDIRLFNSGDLRFLSQF